MSNFKEFEFTQNTPEKNTSGVLGHAIENYQHIVWLSLAVVVISFVASSIFSSIFSSPVNPKDLEGLDYSDFSKVFTQTMSASGGFLSIGVQLLISVLLSPIYVGIIYVAHKSATQQSFSFSDLWIGFKQNTANIMIFGALVMILQFILLAMCVLPALFVMPLFFLGYPLLLFKNCTAIEAFQQSYQITKNHYWSFFGIAVLSILIAIAGVIACGVGVLFTAGFVYAAMYSAYLAFVGVPREI
ncbi:hypothetical protein [Elizabethkingia sp. JS20170427COW]|uniref:hypothetical protein n=1 Tax=Elizabethkingia sp. JS20170427COW TaxID=2583851 RepID=UPI0011109E0C|nr:hypothetical protein [Elizabethkingia sp. JS20170427COW]QCX53170.1 hypothetical protein FGE20_05235 [Elizabethkingia sp. JS20170427COW]